MDGLCELDLCRVDAAKWMRDDLDVKERLAWTAVFLALAAVCIIIGIMEAHARYG